MKKEIEELWATCIKECDDVNSQIKLDRELDCILTLNYDRGRVDVYDKIIERLESLLATPRYPEITIDLSKRFDALDIIGRCIVKMMDARLSAADIAEFKNKIIDDDYDQIKVTVKSYFNTKGE